jgi:hypothetical protein
VKDFFIIIWKNTETKTVMKELQYFIHSCLYVEDTVTSMLHKKEESHIFLMCVLLERMVNKNQSFELELSGFHYFLAG